MSAANGHGLAAVVLGATLVILGLSGCKPSAPPDLLKAQRADLDKARAVEGILLQRADEQRKDIDAASR